MELVAQNGNVILLVYPHNASSKGVFLKQFLRSGRAVSALLRRLGSLVVPVWRQDEFQMT